VSLQNQVSDSLKHHQESKNAGAPFEASSDSVIHHSVPLVFNDWIYKLKGRAVERFRYLPVIHHSVPLVFNDWICKLNGRAVERFRHLR
jgi:hypothetical protein